MRDRKPASFNVVPEDTIGTTWALPEGAIARFGKGDIGDVKLSPDGTYFAVGTGMGLWWYDVSSMSPISLWETKRGLVNSIDFPHDGKWIVIDTSDGIIKMLDIRSGECIAQIEGQDASAGLACSSNGRWIAIAASNGVVKVLDVHSGECIAQMDRGTHEIQPNDISQLEFSPDGKLLAARADNPEVSRDGQVLNPDTEGTQTYVWHPETGEAIVKFAGRDFAFSADSCLLAGAVADETSGDTDRVDRCVSVWDVTTGERISHFSEHNNWVRSIKFSPCGQFLASSDRNSKLHVWDLTKGVLKEIYADYGMSRVEPIYLPEGVLLATVFTRDTIEVWNVEQRQKLQTYERQPESIGDKWFSRCPELPIAYFQSDGLKTTDEKHSFPTLQGSLCYLYPVVFSPNGETLASRRDLKGFVLWDVESKQAREILIQDGLFSSVDALTFLPCGDMLAISRNRDAFKVWRISKTEEVMIAEFTSPVDLGRHVFAFAGYQVAFGGKGGILYLWDLKHNEKPRSLTGHTEHVWSVAFSPDGKQLASGSSDNTAQLWDVETGEKIATLPLDKPRPTMALAFSPCGSVIAGGMDDEIRLWCAEQLTTLRTIPQPEHNRRTYALVFSPCGKYLASGTWWQKGMEKMAIRLWEIATGENVHTFWGHTTDVQSLAFSPDGTLLASGGFDGTILLWDVKPFIDP